MYILNEEENSYDGLTLTFTIVRVWKQFWIKKKKMKRKRKRKICIVINYYQPATEGSWRVQG